MILNNESISNTSLSPVITRAHNHLNTLTDTETQRIAEATEFEIFKQRIWEQTDIKIIELLTSQKINNLSVMRLIVLTINFLVERKTSLNDTIGCIHEPSMTSNKSNDRMGDEEGISKIGGTSKALNDVEKYVKTVPLPDNGGPQRGGNGNFDNYNKEKPNSDNNVNDHNNGDNRKDNNNDGKDEKKERKFEDTPKDYETHHMHEIHMTSVIAVVIVEIH